MDTQINKAKKPFYKRWWFITLAIIIFLGFLGSLGGDSNSSQVASETTTPTPVENQKTAEAVAPVKQTPKTTPKPATVPTTPAPTPTPAPATQSDRASVLVVLKSNASAKWGDNYQMVKYEYDQQVEAYDWVVAQTKYPDIMAKAKQKWGNNYQMVKYEYNQQVEAYEWIMAQTKYPDIMAKAKQKWGTNYQMVQYEYNQQVEAYQSL
jgi:hypothetical protein